MRSCAAIIVAAGSSRRAGFDKLLAPLSGMPVLLRSIRAFASCPEISEIVLVCPEERFASLNIPVDELPIPFTRVDGGKERHESVQNGLQALRYVPKLVAVHDGARPLITSKQIIRCIRAAEQSGASASAHPITDTLKRVDDKDCTLSEQIDRNRLWAMETPQIFQYPLLMEAYVSVFSNGVTVTDEVSALQLIGYPTQMVSNPDPNPKMTWAEDFAFAERLLSSSH